jgi:hypothetical protein
MATVFTLHQGGKSATPEQIRELEAEASRLLLALGDVMPATDPRRLPVVAVGKLLKPLGAARGGGA